MKLAGIRTNYLKHALDAETVGDDPVLFFSSWLDEAIKTGVPEPTAMALSTVSDVGKPSSRMVLLKGIEDGRFKFFTNYNSRKGLEIAVNREVALLFFWPELERQVRIEGNVSKTGVQESDNYFRSRPEESKIGAIASPQSKIIADRSELEYLYNVVLKANSSGEIARPEYWGGYAVIPDSIEFWQGRPGRLHDRIRFRRESDNWIKERLAP